MKEDLELREFRELMVPPDHWENGFGWKSVVGAFFVGMIMTPASMYMGLVMGADIGSAAQWVTIILFIEVARRAFTTLKRPEIYVLYYMSGATLVSGSGLLWQQFIVQSHAFRQFGLDTLVPSWYAPHDPSVLGARSFFKHEWVVPLGLMALAQFIARVDNFGLGYVMYRLTSDVEKLPFPMAPVAAMGVTALADASGGQETWRWRVFSFGAMLGMAFCVVYFALPAISSAYLPQPISIFPVPFKDLTPYTERLLPAVPVMLSFDLAVVLLGMILPFNAMVGSLIGMIAVTIGNVILQKHGTLSTWTPGTTALQTQNCNYQDFYLSFGIGLTLAIAVIGFWHMFSTLIRARADVDRSATAQIDFKNLFRPPPGRGDISIWLALGIYLFSTTTTILTACWLLNNAHQHGVGSPLNKILIAVLIFYGFVYTPIISYVSARMEGIIGQGITIPFVREATFILSGYKGAAIWFAPFPANNYGSQSSYFRQTELTGTSIRSMVWAEMLIFPIVLLATVLFSQFLWRIAPIPSATFPAAQLYWEPIAYRNALITSSTLPMYEHGPFYRAIDPRIIGSGLGIAVGAYWVLSFLGVPVLAVYGLIRGLDGTTTSLIIPQFIGAMLGRYYFRKKFGKDWPQYRVVFFAGYSCGVGLVAMFSLGLVFMSKSVIQSHY